MAELRATPMVNPIMGLLADRLKKVQQFGAKPFGYENPPVEMLMNLLGVPAVQQTMERMAYGEPLTTGRGMTTKPRPEALEAAMTLLPASVGAAKATKGFPVGASIKSIDDIVAKYPDVTIDASVGKKDINLSRIVVPKEMRNQGVGTQVMSDLSEYADSIGKRITLTPSDSFGGSVPKLKAFYKELGFVENKGKNKDFSTREAMYREPQPLDAKPSYPQQEALDTAQRNAALPIEEGGLGLPKDNTPEMRAKAMGYDVDAYHGTNTGDILAFDPALMGKQSGGNLKASFFADRPSAANYYINETPENVVVKPQFAEEYNKIYSKFTDDEAKAIQKFNETYDRNIRSTVQIPWDEANPEVLALKNQARKSADAYFNKYFDKDIVQKPEFFDKNPEGLVYPVKLNTQGLMGYDAGGATWTPYQDQRIKSILSQEGLTLDDVGGVNIKNSYDADVGEKIGVYAISDPSRIRSRFAAFDPMRRNEPDILAGVLPLGLLADEEQRKKLYELMPSLLGE